MTVRKATGTDLMQISGLADEFGHLMTYMQSPEGIEPHVQNIIVNENTIGQVDGFYHYRTSFTLPLRD